MNQTELLNYLRSPDMVKKLQALYVCSDVEKQISRYTHIIESFSSKYGDGELELFSVGGRSELGGNHTDHQHGCILAASVNVDMVSCAKKTDSSVVRIYSEGFGEASCDLNHLEVDEKETGKSASLIRGIANAYHERGYTLGGFDAYMNSEVLAGSGLSSSAAYETLVGAMMNHFWANDELDNKEIAKIGQYAENVYFGKPCGLMDQMACAVGGIVAVDFHDPKAPIVNQVDFPFGTCGYSLCIVDVGADHADLTDEYASIPSEMKSVARYFGQEFLRDVNPHDFYNSLGELRKVTSDRAILRASHFFADNQRAQVMADALRVNDFEKFLQYVNASGVSSAMYLQNIYPSTQPAHQAVNICLMRASEILQGKGACRVHGGGFAGTIQAYVPNELVSEFVEKMDQMLGKGHTHVMKIRPVGAVVITK